MSSTNSARTSVSKTTSLLKSQKSVKLFAQLDAWLKETGAPTPQQDKRYNPVAKKKYRETFNKKHKAQLEKTHARYLDENYVPNKNWWGSKLTRD